MIETGEVKKRVRQVIEQVRRDAVTRRANVDRAVRLFGELLESRAAPVFRQVAGALRAEGYPFQVFTPAGSIRLASDKSGEDFVELDLDTSRDPVVLLVRTSHARGRKVVSTERIVHEGPDLDQVEADDVLAFLLEEIVSLLER